MSVSPNSTSDSTTTRRAWREEIADLTINQDEALDLDLALMALGGIRHSEACDAAERSQRRYDDRNHRLHESRMKSLGMEGEDKQLEDDMAHTVLIRSPTIHNHYEGKQSQPSVSRPASQPRETSGLSKIAKAAIIGAGLLGTAGTGAGLYAIMTRGGNTVVNQLEDTRTGIGLIPPGPPKTGGSP